MPFDLYVSRAATFDAMNQNSAGRRKQGFFARMRSTPDMAPITNEEFHAVMRGAPAERKADHIYWVLTQDGDPWFAAEWKGEGNVLLSTSYSNHRYLRNFADMFDQGLRVAEELDAHLFEEVGGRETTRKNIDALLAPTADYVKLQVGTWHQAMAQLSEKAHAPLEYPLGPIDIVSEYMAFHVTPERAIEHDSVAPLFERTLKSVRVRVAQEAAWCAVDTDGDKWLTKVLHRPDGKWQVWPAWGQSGFSRIAETTLAAAEELHRMAGGDIHFLGRPFEGSLREEARARTNGLGVDFYLWTKQLPHIGGGEPGLPATPR
jgi:hypothetical protein